jgi:ATP-dependent Lon protease
MNPQALILDSKKLFGFVLELPWNVYSKDNFDLKRAEKILDQDHFGLEEVKKR